MFKLSVTFATLVELSAFVTKMGGSVVGGEITHSQPVAVDDTAEPAAPATASRKRGSKKTQETVVQEAPVSTPPATPFPAPGVVNFAPGAPAAAQPAPAPIAPAPASAPVVAPVAPTQAPPVITQPAVSPERAKVNQACADLIGTLEQLGPTYQQSSEQALKYCFESVQAQVPKISLLNDQQVNAFYQNLHQQVTNLVAHYNANLPQQR